MYQAKNLLYSARFVFNYTYVLNANTVKVLEHTIRLEIASCSEKSYPFVPISSAKTLFFLDSEGAVLQFAKDRGWVAKDGRIYFPNQQGESVRSEREILRASGQVIENTIGYARELETIV